MNPIHLDPLQTIILALLQGITELFPISSLGHTVILPGLLPGIFNTNGTSLVTDPNFPPTDCRAAPRHQYRAHCLFLARLVAGYSYAHQQY